MTLRSTLPPWQNEVAPETFTVGTEGLGLTVTMTELVELEEHPDVFETTSE